MMRQSQVQLGGPQSCSATRMSYTPIILLDRVIIPLRTNIACQKYHQRNTVLRRALIRHVQEHKKPPHKWKTSRKTHATGGFVLQPLSQSTEEFEERAAAPSNNRFFRPDAREVFQNTPSTTALVGSSSTSESNSNDGQGPWQGNSEEDYRESPQQSPQQHRVNPLRSPRFGKGYPKGEDDQEESVRLWQRQSLDHSEEGTLENNGGVRLVPK